MKKLLYLLFVLIFLSSCDRTIAKMQYPIVADGSLRTVCNDVEYEADLLTLPNGKITMDIISPKELRGVCFVSDDEGFSVIKDDIEINYTSDLLERCPFTSLINIINTLNSHEPEFTASGNVLMAELNVDNSICKIYLDNENLNIKQICTADFVFEFFNRGG